MEAETIVLIIIITLSVFVGGGLVGFGVWLGMGISREIWTIAKDNSFTSRDEKSSSYTGSDRTQ